eukprot:CAMPEP_0172304114 /NCGR_PEP_ID=MMETSP1058-20130122/5557_1 /TAXON_ID=83371 /ORGANISM="Detonula confervacea, Strain CCMP 353" /LENGTH=471 /DNA_ID=CAMNT_0013015201 /DNA_START=191 /DNA_END=1606 /DNA_ORIENTATION=+
MGNDDNLSDYERDKIDKQSLVLKIIAEHCTSDSEHDDIRVFADALGGGLARLGIENLSGGYTNYTYKVYLKKLGDDEDAPHHHAALFVKLCFPRAFWNPDPEYVYDVRRIENEAIMMNKFATLAPGCVATPYLLLDVEGGMKLLATQWSSTDEQLGNQSIDGLVDVRVAKNLAVAIAALHNSDLDKDFNTEARDCMIELFPSMKEKLFSLIEDAGDGRAGKIAKGFGPELCREIFERAEESYRANQIPCHFDLHFFNVLVEAKPDAQYLEQFGPTGSFCVCDWEMAAMGPLGIDTGRLYSIPVACIIAHALGGHDEVTEGILNFLDVYWKEYSTAMVASGKDDEYLKTCYRNGIAWLGWKLFAISVFDWFVPFLPIEPSDVDKFKDSVGALGIRLMRYGFISDEAGEDHFSLYQTIHDELACIKSYREPDTRVRNRRSSVLRESNRRVSDAFQSISLTSLLNAALADLTIE